MASEHKRHDFRTQVALLWQRSAALRRADIFGLVDENRPKYRKSELDWQADVVAAGLVGANYRPGGMVLLSVKPAGGRHDFCSDSRSDEVYERFRVLREPESPLAAFEESNSAVLRSIRSWGSISRDCEKILAAAGKCLNDIAFLYVIPFRTSDDSSSSAKGGWLENGYTKHLKGQLELLSPKHIAAIHKGSYEAAMRFRRDCSPTLNVLYY